MKLHLTDTLETAPSFRARFHGAHEAAQRVKPEITTVGERSSAKGRWKAALFKWQKIQQGRLSEHAVKLITQDNADKFRVFEKNGGRIPSGV